MSVMTWHDRSPRLVTARRYGATTIVPDVP